MSKRPLRLGMVGGGQGAYIGNIHRLASRLDGHWTLVAGAFDVDPDRGREFAINEGLDPARSYGTFQDLIAGERGREDRVDAMCHQPSDDRLAAGHRPCLRDHPALSVDPLGLSAGSAAARHP